MLSGRLNRRDRWDDRLDRAAGMMLNPLAEVGVGMLMSVVIRRGQQVALMQADDRVVGLSEDDVEE